MKHIITIVLFASVFALPSLLDVNNFAMTHSCWLYVDSKGVFIIKGPLAISLPFTWALCSLVEVIGGPIDIQ